MTTKVNPKWMALAVHPSAPLKFQCVTNINGHEFVATTHIEAHVICKYNIHKNEFSKYIDVSKVDNTSICYGITARIAFDDDTKNLYLYQHFSEYKAIHIININTNKNQFIKHCPYGQYMLLINNNLHIFDNYDKHWIGTILNKTLYNIHNTLSSDISKCCQGSAIYVPSKQCIVLIGGFDDNYELIKDLWIYSLISQKWTQKENMSFEGYSFGAILTSNQQYIILFGGKNDENAACDHVDNISVLDMTDDNEWKIRKSSICCPDIGECHLSITGGVDSKDEILVIGFVKQCFATKEFKQLQLPPIYIMMLIAKWYTAEIIHWLKGDKHYAIYLKDILSSLL